MGVECLRRGQQQTGKTCRISNLAGSVENCGLSLKAMEKSLWFLYRWKYKLMLIEENILEGAKVIFLTSNW